MSLFDILAPLQTVQGEINLKLNASGESRWTLTIQPLVGIVNDKLSDEGKRLKAALALPIKVIGTEQEILKDLSRHITEQMPQRTAWADRVAHIEGELKAAQAAKPNPTMKPANNTTTSSSANPAPAALEPLTNDFDL